MSDWVGPLVLPAGPVAWRVPRAGGPPVAAVCWYWRQRQAARGCLAAVVGTVVRAGGRWQWLVRVAVVGRRGRLLWRRWGGGYAPTAASAKGCATRAARRYGAAPQHLGWTGWEAPALAVV